MTIETNAPERSYTLKPLVSCPVEQQMVVRELRNGNQVRDAMYTDHLISVNEHLSWINSLKSDPNQLVWCVLRDRLRPVGVVSINAIDRKNLRADWAFYLAESERGGVGSALEYFVLQYFFNEMGFEKLNCEVLEANLAVVAMHRKFGFSDEGFRRNNIMKNGQRVGVHLLGITNDEWDRKRPEIEATHAERFARISVNTETPEHAEASVIDLIQNARARNNINWMALLRLSVEDNGEVARDIIREIMSIDREISDLTGRLVEEGE